MSRIELRVQPLTRSAFSDFGDVIETAAREHYTINQGHAERYNDLAQVEVLADGGRPLISIFRANPWPTPIRVKTMERHPLSSQAFMPLSSAPFLVIVAAPTESLAPSDLHAFVTNGRQGVNFAPRVWHHALLALKPESDFLVVDRGGPGTNCDEITFDEEIVLQITSFDTERNS